jgi:hypothetical protein
MAYEVCAEELRERLTEFRFATDGDCHEEQNSGSELSVLGLQAYEFRSEVDHFPRCPLLD